MKVLVLSDLHLEFGEPYLAPAGLDFDVVVLADDIDSGAKAVEWARLAFSHTPVLFVPGNHEFYRRIHSEELKAMKAAAAGSNVHVLDRSSLVARRRWRPLPRLHRVD